MIPEWPLEVRGIKVRDNNSHGTNAINNLSINPAQKIKGSLVNFFSIFVHFVNTLFECAILD